MDPVAIVGAVAGWLAGVIYSGGGFGLVGNIIVGMLGAIIAGYSNARAGNRRQPRRVS